MKEGEHKDYPDPVPHPTRGRKSEWKDCICPRGPLGMLIQSVRRMGAKIDDEFRIWQKGEPNIHLIDTPYQHLADLLMEAACRARTVAAKGTKEANAVLKEIDSKVTNIGKKKLDPKKKALSKRFKWEEDMPK